MRTITKICDNNEELISDATNLQQSLISHPLFFDIEKGFRLLTQKGQRSLPRKCLDAGCGEDAFHQVLVDPGVSL